MWWWWWWWWFWWRRPCFLVVKMGWCIPTKGTRRGRWRFARVRAASSRVWWGSLVLVSVSSCHVCRLHVIFKFQDRPTSPPPVCQLTFNVLCRVNVDHRWARALPPPTCGKQRSIPKTMPSTTPTTPTTTPTMADPHPTTINQWRWTC